MINLLDSTVLIRACIFCLIISVALWTALFQSGALSGSAKLDGSLKAPTEGLQTSAPDWVLEDEKYTGNFDPQAAFLWYTKGEKTSSTVASTIIARAYEKAGLNVVTDRYHVLASAPGAYASVAHFEFSEERLKLLRRAVQRPVLLVVSIREGSDWVLSQTYRAERLNKTKGRNSLKILTCDSLMPEIAICERYKKYLPSIKSDTAAWWILRHEHMVEDTCAMLKALGLSCPITEGIGQRSRSNMTDLMSCELPDFSKEISCINRLNQETLRKSPAGR